ncbi:hypothetical protein [Tessaracoccus sp. Z1128]
MAKGIAWSVPAVAIASTAPAFAVSGPAPTMKFVSACKSPGGSCATFKFGYALTYEVTNNDDKTIYITNAEMFCTSGADCPAGPYTWKKLPGEDYTIAAGDTETITFVFLSTNSANKVFDGYVELTWQHAAPDNYPHTKATGVFSVGSTPPDCPCYS